MVKSKLLYLICWTALMFGLINISAAQSVTNKDNNRSLLKESPVVKKQFQNRSETESGGSVRIEDFHYVPRGSGKQSADENGLFTSLQTKPGWALLSSALVPGSGQFVNNKYIRGALYFAADVAALYVHITQQNQAQDQEQRYKNFANNNYSVVNYARWLVNYHEVHGMTGESVENLKSQVQDIQDIPYGKKAWDKVNLSTLRNVEQQTPFVYPSGRIGNIFSHTMPDYGSQQYYELISKYYQFGPGWNDFGFDQQGNQLDNLYQLSWDGSDMPANWYKGADLAHKFNESYKLAGNMLKLMVVNHVISAFDAFFTVKLKQHKLKADATLINGGGMVAVNYSF